MLIRNLALRLGAILVSLTPLAFAQNLRAVEVASGFTDPVFLCAAPGDLDRLFILEQTTGRIRIIKDGNPLATPFLDVGAISSSGAERGLLGMAFHPDYFGQGSQGEGRFFINYTNNAGDTVLREYRAGANPDVADAASFATLLTVAQPFAHHNGGCIQFGPDGLLYIGMGDGGDPAQSQDGTSLLGKMLRLDVDLAPPFIPASNPFVGVAGFDDMIWSLGFRNPWRFSFDRLTGAMWIADVGQWTTEEVNYESAASGGANYGWRCLEGSICTGMSGCNCNSGTVLPVVEYGHALGCAIVGGYRYRGSAMPGFVGRYFYADYCGSHLWSVDFDGSITSGQVNHRSEMAIAGTEFFTSMGEDAAGELYLVDNHGGQIFRLEQDCPETVTTYCALAPNSAGAGATLQLSGSVSIAANNIQLTVTGCPSQIPGQFFYGPAQTNLPLGDGSLCVGGPIYRQQPVEFTDSQGVATKMVDFTSGPEGSGPGQILPGSNWFFQYWYRDMAAGGLGSNLSTALDVSFCP